MSRDDAPLSDADLERIERAAKMNPRVDPPLGLRLRVEGFTEEVVVALVAEVRRLRARSDVEGPRYPHPDVRAGRVALAKWLAGRDGPDAYRIDDDNDQTALVEAVLSAEPAPLDTGRVTCDVCGEPATTTGTPEPLCAQHRAEFAAFVEAKGAAIIRNEEKTDGLA